jgi:hypothetical protein
MAEGKTGNQARQQSLLVLQLRERSSAGPWSWRPAALTPAEACAGACGRAGVLKAGVVRLAWEIAIGLRRLEWSDLPLGGLGSGERWPFGDMPGGYRYV